MKKLILSLVLSMTFITAVKGNPYSVKNGDNLFRDVNKKINNYSQPVATNELESIEENTSKLVMLMKQLKRVDYFAKGFGVHINENVKSEKVLTGDEVYIISSLANVYHQISVKINEVNSFAKPQEVNKSSQNYYQLKDQRKLLWLASYLSLFESYKQNKKYYYESGKLRRMLINILKTSDDKNERVSELITMVSHVFEENNIETIRKHLVEYDLQGPVYEEANEVFLKDWIRNSTSYHFIVSKKKLKIKNHVFVDNLISMLGRVTNAISGIFGNLVGKVRWRHGHLYGDKTVIKRLHKDLRPLDILLEKTPFALTDSFIPGHFGHAAIYLGTEKELKDIGLWDSEVIRPYQSQISNGYTIIEAVRPGVRLTTLDHFMQVDDILIMRSNIDIEDVTQTSKVYYRAFNQLGKEYDFNFDVETTDKIVCSELIFFAFGNINWPTEYVLGRPTISPDNVAELIYYKNTPVSFTLNLWSKKKGIITNVTKEDLGSKIGYKLNKSRSSKESQSYDKKSTVCKTVVKRRIRVGSRRRRRLEFRVCREKLEQRVYEHHSTTIREKLYGNTKALSNY